MREVSKDVVLTLGNRGLVDGRLRVGMMFMVAHAINCEIYKYGLGQNTFVCALLGV